MTHQYVSVEKIWTEERQRQEFKQGPIQDLADSILRNGLIHAPVVNKEFRLIAGERRLRALKLCEGKSVLYGDDVFEYPEIPVHVIDRDDPQTIFELELEENLRRVNLTPMEEAKALAQLHAIRLQANPAQTRKDTAQEISKLQGKSADSKSNTDEVKVAQAILVDQFKDDPEVQQAAKVSLAKAARVAKKKIENEILRALHADEAEAAGGDAQLAEVPAEHAPGDRAVRPARLRPDRQLQPRRGQGRADAFAPETPVLLLHADPLRAHPGAAAAT